MDRLTHDKILKTNFLFVYFFGWGMVFRVISGVDYHCSKIDYFPKEDYIPDASDSTMAIPCKYSISEIVKFFKFHFEVTKLQDTFRFCLCSSQNKGFLIVLAILVCFVVVL